MKNITMAWRNLWRNRRRTMITSASVFFAVLFALFFRSLQLGSYDHMFRNAIEAYTGYIQVQHRDYWDEKVVDHSFPYDPELARRVVAPDNVISDIPRFESFALASNGPQTKGVLVMGVDPEKEEHLSQVREKKVRFRIDEKAAKNLTGHPDLPEKTKELIRSFQGTSYSNASRLQLDLGISDKEAPEWMPLLEAETRFENGDIRMGDSGAWVGDNLAKFLDLDIGDTLVLIGQGYHASTAAGKYPIRGIVKMPLPDIDNKVVYLPLDICQNLYNAGNNLTSLALAVRDNSDEALAGTLEELSGSLGEDLRLMEWREMNELLVNQMDADNKSGIIMIGILYLVIAFGVFGTVLMLTAERKREFGVLVAIGMQKRKLSAVMSLEMLLVGFLGILGGAVLGGLLILYGMHHPLIFKGEMAKMFEDYGMEPMMVFQGPDGYFLWQIVIVALMVGLALIYPLVKIRKLKVVTALRA
ncbi:MAG: FtsX-like permease family protein [Bacteroidales bacterium]